jgi:glutamine synthetase
VPVDHAGYFDHVPHGNRHDFRRAGHHHAGGMGISVEFSHHEGAPGQNEIDLRYADALSTADNIMTFRTVVKEVALEQGIFASFMPKPFAEHPGSGMHTHLSLFEGDTNAFHEPGAPYQLSARAGSSSPACCVHGARDHRGHQPVGQLLQAPLGRGRGTGIPHLGPQQPLRLVRVPMYKPTRATATRVEVRSHRQCLQPLPGLRGAARRRAQGHRGGLRAAARDRGRRVELTDAERRAMGIAAAARQPQAAIIVMEGSELVAETLGEHVFDFFLRNKRAEWADYRNQVSAFELDRYLPRL